MENKELKNIELKLYKYIDDKFNELNVVVFKNIEDLISFLPKYKAISSNLQEDLNLIDIYIKQSKNDNVNVQSSKIFVDDLTKKLDKKEKLTLMIAHYDYIINIVENALDSIKNDKYYSIIELKYHKKLKNDEIAQILFCDERTVRNNKNRLIKELKTILTPLLINIKK